MPYKISKKKSGWLVTKKNTGQVVGRHSTKSKALAQVRAIYANKAK